MKLFCDFTLATCESWSTLKMLREELCQEIGTLVGKYPVVEERQVLNSLNHYLNIMSPWKKKLKPQTTVSYICLVFVYVLM